MTRINEHAEIGIIGGSGFYRMKGIEDSHYIELDTPFGQPSERILLGKYKEKSFAFISRHGIGHRFNPSEVNYRANLFALKLLGVTKLFSVAAVGSLKEEIKPMDLVIWDQYFDNTFKRAKTFFEEGVVAHVSMAEPICPCLSTLVHEKAKALGTGLRAPFMTLSFMALLVIPALKLSDQGLFDGNTFKFTSLFID